MFIRRDRVRSSMPGSVQKIGTNDALYTTNPKIEGRTVPCPYYRKWNSMLQRCYSIKYQENQPTYKDCTVSKDWLYFSNFLAWMEERYKEYFLNIHDRYPTKEELHNADELGSLCLDKDILVLDNKIYSADTCCLCSKEVNSLLVDCEAARGKYAKGVFWDSFHKKFKASLNIRGHAKHLGYFDLEEEALLAYNKAKRTNILSIATQQPPKICEGLVRYAETFSG